MNPIKVGIIGTGAIAHSAHLPAMQSLSEDFALVSILGREYEKAQQTARKFNIGHAAETFDGFLKQDMDAVVLLTPRSVRGEYLYPLMEAGLDILVEKPMGMTIGDCFTLADTAEKLNRKVMVAFNRRFSPVNQIGFAAFQGKQPQYMLAQKNREMKEYRATLENAIHMIDLMRYALGECVAVSAAAAGEDLFFEDILTAQLTFESGAIGLLGACRQAGQWYERVEMYGHNITAIMESPEHAHIITPEEEKHWNMTQIRKGLPSSYECHGFTAMAKHFADCLREDRQPITSAQDAFKTHKLLNRILAEAGLPDLSRAWD